MLRTFVGERSVWLCLARELDVETKSCKEATRACNWGGEACIEIIGDRRHLTVLHVGHSAAGASIG